MTGLLGQGWEDPRSAAVMALAGGLLKGDFGGGLLGANQAFAEAKNSAFKKQYMDMQMQEMQAQIEERKRKTEQARKDEEMFQSIFGPQQAQQGQLGSGSFGIMPTATGVPSVPAGGGQRVPKLTYDQLAMLKRRGLDLFDIYKHANDPLKMEAGSTYRDRVTGQERYMPKLPEGATVTDGRVGAMPGYMDLLAQTTLAQQAPKTMLDAAGRINLRPNADGTQSPVSELTENPTLQNLVGGVFGRNAQPQPATQPQPLAQPPANRPVVSPTAQRTADAESVLMMRDELKNPNLPLAHRQAIEREIARIEQASAGPGFPAPSLIRNPQGYGKTTAQTIAEEAERTRQVEQAKADVVPAATAEKNSQRQMGNLAKADSVIKEIRDAKSLVGWNTAGVLGTLSVLPATEARDLSAKLTAIKANLGFDELQKMREQSPTGGALGGVAIQELVALQSTVASLDQLQTPAQLGKALDKIEMHYTKWRETVEQARSQQGGASGGWGIREKR